MPREMLLGTVAGAVGAVALNAATYADMAVRARPSSSVPAAVHLAYGLVPAAVVYDYFTGV